MSLSTQPLDPIPPETVRAAQAAFPKGSLAIHLRNQSGTLYTDALFADLFPRQGQAAEAPVRLALASLLQFMEGLTDRQAADAVRTRIDWVRRSKLLTAARDSDNPSA